MSYGQNAPQGFKAVSTNLAASWTEATRDFQLNPATTTANGGTMYSNDVVVAAATGYILQAQSVGGGNNLNIVGVFQSCYYTLPSLAGPNGPFTNSPYFPGNNITLQAGTNAYGKVLTDPNTIYDVQADPALANGFAFTNIFNTAQITIVGAVANQGGGNVATGLSTMTLGTPGTVATNAFKIYGFSQSNIVGLTNQQGQQYNNVLALINTPWTAYNTAGI